MTFTCTTPEGSLLSLDTRVCEGSQGFFFFLYAAFQNLMFISQQCLVSQVAVTRNKIIGMKMSSDLQKKALL